MDGPITVSIAAIALAKFAGHVMEHVGYHEAHHFYREFLERWSESPIDPATGLPRNHDLQEASLAALREAGLVLVMELAGRLDPRKPWLPRLVEHIRTGKLFNVPLFEAGNDPKHAWVEGLRNAINSERLAILHNRLLLSEDDVRHCFAGGDLCAAFGPMLIDRFLDWARSEIEEGKEPQDFAAITRQGWKVSISRGPTVTLAQAYCLFFREHLKRQPAVFNILVADTLNEIRNKISTLDKFSVPKLDFNEFERWLEPQVNELRNLLGGLGQQVATLAQGQAHILVAVTALAIEVKRGNDAAKTDLNNLLLLAAAINAGMELLLEDAIKKDKHLDEIQSALDEMLARMTTVLTQCGAAQDVCPVVADRPFSPMVLRWFRSVIALHESGQLVERNLQVVFRFVLCSPLKSATTYSPRDAVREAIWRERAEPGWFAKKSLFEASADELQRVRIGEDCPVEVQQVRVTVKYELSIFREKSGVRFVLVPPGTVASNGKLQVNASLFYLAETPLSQQQWAKLMPDHAPPAPQTNLAMCGLSAAQIEKFISRHGSAMELPTIDQLRFAALWSEEGYIQKQPLLKQQSSNPFGLFDMLGVTWQFCRHDTQRHPLLLFGAAFDWERPLTRRENPAPDSDTFPDPTASIRPVLRSLIK